MCVHVTDSSSSLIDTLFISSLSGFLHYSLSLVLPVGLAHPLFIIPGFSLSVSLSSPPPSLRPLPSVIMSP